MPCYIVTETNWPMKQNKEGWIGGRRRDSRVEGLELTSSHKNSKITTNRWTTINKDWKLPKKILYIQRQRRRSHSRGSTFSVQSNSILVGWATYTLENNYIAEILPQEWESWAPYQAPQPGGLSSEGGAPRAFGFEGQQKLYRPGGNRDSTLGGHTQVFRTKQWLHKYLSQAYLWVLEGFLGRKGLAVTLCGGKDTGGRGPREYSSVWALPEVTILAPRPPIQQPAGSFQCWDASGQTTNRLGTQPNPSADRLPEVILSSQPMHTPWHSTAHQQDKTQVHPPVSRQPSLPPGSLKKSLDQPHPPWDSH